jgi:hypothetical protein
MFCCYTLNNIGLGKSVALPSQKTTGPIKEMENISIEVLPSGILSLSSQSGPCRTLRLHRTRVQTILYPSIKCNVLRESLSEDSQNIPCATPGLVCNLCVQYAKVVCMWFYSPLNMGTY